MMTSVSELRQAFLTYFQSKGHTLVPSSPLIPANDPSLLFTNAGMVQFKDTFLGIESRHYTTAASCQRCVRAGGKHNDLENVGYTARHHTFFEMLGNFSFGAYFKREAIHFAWEFLTQKLHLPPEKLWITVYEEDDEAADIWLKELEVDASRFSRCGMKDNFWSMGDTGPCGPCSEIFYDHGNDIAGGHPGSGEDGDRYIEIWNLVFMQYNRDAQGHLTPLPKPSVDTGMGLERLAAVMQGVHNNYEIDLFHNLIKEIAKLANCQDLTNSSLRVIADHIRASAFLISDGIVPSNEGRGYVLRRIIRRAIRHGHQLGLRESFFFRLVKPLVIEMGVAYSDLAKNQQTIIQVLKQEEERFSETLDRGMRLLEQAIAELAETTIIPGDVVFKLYDTYGFPTDLTADIARERNLTLNMADFDRAMAEQRTRSGAASQFDSNYNQSINLADFETLFTGYKQTQDESTIIAIIRDGNFVSDLTVNQGGQIILNRTPFYAESGGQVGDKGTLCGEQSLFEVDDTQKQGKVHIHLGILMQGRLQVGDKILAKIDVLARQAIARNHSATHLLHAALRQILGHHVNQKGSLVQPERLRFDFSHIGQIMSEQLHDIEQLVNHQILLNTLVVTEILPVDQAMKCGAMALFGEKYDEQVRVLTMGTFSKELCGGTHVHRIGNIGLFKIIAETGVAAGVRRIEAITGYYALNWLRTTQNLMLTLATVLKTNRESLEDRVTQLVEQNRALEKELERLQAKLASNQGSDLANQAQDINGIKVLAIQVDNLDAKQLRNTLDQLKNKLGTAAIVLASVGKDNKIALVAGVTDDLTAKIKAGDLVNHLASQIGGKGGGRADMAQGGGNEPTKLPNALHGVTHWIKTQLG
jgi:alanyl-tRNA synthetase